MKKVFVPLLAVILAFSAAVVLSAEEAEQAPFTEKELDSFIRDWPRFTSWIEEKGKSIENADNPALLMAALSGADSESFLRENGWEPERFYYIAGRSTMALVVLKAREEQPEMIAQLDNAIAEIRANTDVSEEEKADAIAELEELKALFMGVDQVFDVDEREVALVEARRDTLRQLFDIE